MRDEYGFGAVRLQKFSTDVLKQLEMQSEGYVTYKDILDMIAEETGFDVREEKWMSDGKHKFYELQSNGTIFWSSVAYFDNHEISVKAQGNLFETSKEAEREQDRRNLLHRIEQFRYQRQRGGSQIGIDGSN